MATKEEIKFFEILLAGAERGDEGAQNEVGTMYSNGAGTTKNDKLAVEWFRKAAGQGYAMAQYNLGLQYANGTGVPKDGRQAADWYRKAAEQGYASAQFNLGLMYANGTAVPKDERQAADWYRKAAEQGYASAQNNLGAMYDNGTGVPKDESEAADWYRKAAEQGDASAQNNLGVMYDNGTGVPKDESEAADWYRKAAEQGHASAQNNLGWQYANGAGVPKDDQQAVAWYRKAAEQGQSNAKVNLRDLEARLRNAPSDSSTSSKRASSPSSARVPTPGPVAKKRIETMEKVFMGIGAVILIFYVATWLASAYRWVAQGPVFKSESGPLRDAASTAALSPEILAKFNTGTTGKTVPPKAVDSRPSNTVLRPAMESTPTPTEIPRAAPKPEAATNVVARPIQPPAPMQQTTPQTPSRAPEAQSSAVDPDVKMPSPVVNDTKKSVEELRQQVVGELKGMTRTMAVSSAGGITPGPLGWQKGKERDFAAVQTMLASFQRSRIPVSVETAALTGKDQQGKTVTTESFKSITVLLDPIETEIRNGNTDIVNAIQALAALCMTRNESMRIITRRSDAPGIFVKVEGWIGQGFVKGYQSMSTPPLAVVQQPLDSGPGKASFIRIEPRDQTQFAKE